MDVRPSCAIIGAGPAGSAAAGLLARAGWEVTIFEKARFPRAKVCGEFISPAATDLLEAMICARDLEGLGARRCGEVAIEAGAGETRWRMPRAGWALSRGALDQALLERAREAGARVMAPAIVRAVRYGGAGVIVRADGAGATGELRADIVIHADGFGRHDPAGSVPIDTRLVAFKRHFQRDPEPGVVRLRSEPGAYIGTIDVEGGLSTCAWVTRRVPPPSRGAVAQRSSELQARAAGAFGSRTSEAAGSGGTDCDSGGRLRHAPPGRWGYPFGPPGRGGYLLAPLACPVPRSGYIAPGHPRSFRIGNAAAAVDPVGGEGIGLALWSARALADVLGDGDASGGALARAQAEFARRYRARLRTRLPACRLAAEALMRPAVARALRPTLDLGAMGPWYRLTGKPGRADTVRA